MNTQTSTLNRARTAALIDNAIELSYGNLVEKKRLPLSTKPNSNSNPEIQAKLIKNILAEPPLKFPTRKFPQAFACIGSQLGGVSVLGY